MKWWTCLIPISLLATVNEPFRWEWMSGYRNDRLHWHLQMPGDGSDLTYSERYANVQFWDNELAFRVIHRDLALYLQGGYSAFGRGDLRQRFAYQPYATNQPRLYFPTDGWAANGDGYVGYAVNLTAGRTYKVILMPLVGFSGYYEQLKGKGSETFSSDHAIGATSYSLTTSYPKHIGQWWWGVYVGGGFRIEPGGRMTFDCGYAYHWLRLSLESHFNETLSLYDGDALDTQTEIENKVNAKQGGNLGHTGWADLEYRLNQVWRLGLAAQIRYFVSNVLTVTQHQTTTDLVPSSPAVETSFPQKFKLRWTSISGYLTISREF